MRTISAAVAALALAGCASQEVVWRKHGAGPGQLEHDRAGCAYEAQLRLATYSGPHMPRARSAGEAFAQGIVQGIDIEVRKAALVTACMQARGYHAAPVGAAPTAPAAAYVGPPTAAPPDTDGSSGGRAPAAAYSDPRDRMNAPVEPPVAASAPGQWTFVVEKLAHTEKCEAVNISVTTSGPGFEHYSVRCSNQDALAVRCDLGTCRVLK